MIDVHFTNGRANAVAQTYSYDVTLTNNTGYDLLTPVILSFDSLDPAGTQPEGGTQQQSTGAWWLDLSSLFPGGRFTAGETSAVDTITFYDPSGLRISFQASVLAMPTPNAPPVIDSSPVTAATVGPALSVSNGCPRRQQCRPQLPALQWASRHDDRTPERPGFLDAHDRQSGPGRRDH